VPQPSPRQIAEEKQSALLSKTAARLKIIVENIEDIDKRLRKLKDQRGKLVSERTRLRRIIYETPTLESRNSTSSQGLFVHTRYLMPYVDKWISEYNAIHIHGGTTTLARRANIHPKTIRSYRSGVITYAGILTVDRILTVIDQEGIMDSLPFITFAELTTRHRNPQFPQPPQPPPSQFYEE
jgi:hypothetical protein